MINSFLIGSMGTLAGVSAGATANLLRNGGSLLARGTVHSCKNTPFLGESNLKAINDFREVFPPLILLGASSQMISLANSYYYRFENGGGVTSFFKTYWKRYFKQNISYAFRNITTETIGIIARAFLDREAEVVGIDISGHALIQVFCSIQAIQILSVSEKHNGPWQKTALKVLAIGIGIIDAIWMYNTTSNCHSVADVVIGVGLAVGSDCTALGMWWCLSKVGSAVTGLFRSKTQDSSTRIRVPKN